MNRKNHRKLSEIQIRLLKFVLQYSSKHGYPPTIRDIKKQVGFSSPSMVHYNVKILIELGYIAFEPNIPRSIRVIKPINDGDREFALNVQQKLQDTLRIRVVGPIVAGEPIPVPSSDFSYYDEEDFIEIVPNQLSERNWDQSEIYALRVDGDSMIDDMINDGDIVIMRKTNQAQNGDTVAAWLPDTEETTLKRFYREKDRIRLQPANPTMDPIYISNTQTIEIQGKVLQTISNK